MVRVTIKKLAEEIRHRWPHLYVQVEQGYANTDRKIGRLRSPGKGRTGSRIIVSQRDAKSPSGWRVVLDHNQAEAYRRTDDVVRWIERYAAERAELKRRRKPKGCHCGGTGRLAITYGESGTYPCPRQSRKGAK